MVRGARNYPCADVPGKRAATPTECRSNEPYVPLGTNPWYGDPNQILNCPAPAARCDQPVKPGYVIPAPIGEQRHEPVAGRPVAAMAARRQPVSDPLTPPGLRAPSSAVDNSPTRATTLRHQAVTAIYNPQSGEVVGPDGVEVLRQQLEQPRRRRMEGDAGTRRLNPTDAEDAPDDSVAASDPEQISQEPEDSPPKSACRRSRRRRCRPAVAASGPRMGGAVSARCWCCSPRGGRPVVSSLHRGQPSQRSPRPRQ